MDIVGLISGGKDSVYNLLECVRMGHRVVCLANLHPALAALEGDTPQELDSWMYQTVGWNVVPALAEAMGLPLIRRSTHGVAVHSGLSYPTSTSTSASTSSGGGVDEVEDLYALLRDVLAAHPSVRGVAVGAILSSYQRVRVEAVCARLGLVPLAMLWQREQGGLLADMGASGLRAALVKVAAMGLSPEVHLGREVTALLPALLALHSRVGLHVCGEGGEYETLTLDSPLHTRGVVVLPSVGGSESGSEGGGGARVVRCGGGAAHLAVDSREVRVVARECPTDGGKEGGSVEGVNPAMAALDTRLLAWDWKKTGQQRQQRQNHPKLPPIPPYTISGGPLVPSSLPTTPQKELVSTSPPPSTLAVACYGSVPPPFPPPSRLSPSSSSPVHLECTARFIALAQGSHGTSQANALALVGELKGRLAELGSSLWDIVNIHLYLGDMGAFSLVNAVFQRAWEGEGEGGCGNNLPPSRSCIGVSVAAAAEEKGEGEGEEGTAKSKSFVSLDAWVIIGSSTARGRSGSAASGAGAGTAGACDTGTGGHEQHQLQHRATLSVTSCSKWAPMCIGPYSQSVALEGGAVLLPAGQIGLIPHAMALPPPPPMVAPPSKGGGSLGPNWRDEVRQSLRNLSAVLGVQGGGVRNSLSFLIYTAPNLPHHALPAVRRMINAWVRSGGVKESESEEGEGEEPTSVLPSHQEWMRDFSPPTQGIAGVRDRAPHPCAFLPVAALPRGACVEVEAIGLGVEGEKLLGGTKGWNTTATSTSSTGSSSTDAHVRSHCIPGLVASVWAGATTTSSSSSPTTIAGSTSSSLLEESLKACVEGVVRGLREGGGMYVKGGCGGEALGVRVYMAGAGAGEWLRVKEWVEKALKSALGETGNGGGGSATPVNVGVSVVPLPSVLGVKDVSGGGSGGTTAAVHAFANNFRKLRAKLWFHRAHKSCGVWEGEEEEEEEGSEEEEGEEA